MFARRFFLRPAPTRPAAESPLKLSVAVGQENPVEPVILAEMAAAVQAMEMAAVMPRSFLLQSK